MQEQGKKKPNTTKKTTKTSKKTPVPNSQKKTSKQAVTKQTGAKVSASKSTKLVKNTKQTQQQSLKKDYEELKKDITKAVESVAGETWIKIGYGFVILYTVALFYRYYYAISWLKPKVLTNNIILILTCAVLPFGLWVISTNFERWKFHDRKKLWIYISTISAVATLEQPLMPLLYYNVVTRIMNIPVTENMTEGMVVFLARLCIFMPYLLVNIIISVPLHNALTSLEAQEKIEDFMISQVVDMRKNKGHLYDLHIVKNLKNGRVENIEQEDRFVHMFINGQTGTGKTSSTIIPAVAEDLNTKIKNMKAREEALLLMLKARKAYIAPPFAKVTEANIRPAKGHEEEFKELYKKYPDCGVTIMAPNNDINNKIVDLCEARGIPVNVVDPAKKYKTKWALAMGIANFYIPENLSEYEKRIQIVKQADTFAEVLVATYEAKGDNDPYFRDINTSVTTNIAIACMLAASIRGEQTDIIEISICINNFRELEEKIKTIEDYYDIHIDTGFTTNTKKSGPLNVEAMQEKMQEKIENKGKGKGKDNPYYTTILFVKNELLGQGAEKMNDQSRGLRNLINKVLLDDRYKDILSKPIDQCVNFDKMLSNNEVTVVNTALEYGAPMSTALGIMFLLNFQTAVQRRPMETRSNHFIWVDEAAQYMHPVYENMYSLYRQYRVCTALAMQSTSQMDKNKSTAYLKDIILGAGTQILFGRVSAEEMKLYENLAGEKLEDSIQKTISQTSLFTSSASQNESERMTKEKKNIVTGRDIRRRNFQEVTVFKIKNNKVQDAFLGKCSFLDKKELEPQQIIHVNFGKLVPQDKIKKEVRLSKPAKKLVKEQTNFIEKKKEPLQILSMDREHPMHETKIEDTYELNVPLQKTIEEEKNPEVKPIEKSSNTLQEVDKVLQETMQETVEEQMDFVDDFDNSEDSLFGNLFEEEPEETVNTNSLEEELKALMERKKAEGEDE